MYQQCTLATVVSCCLDLVEIEKAIGLAQHQHQFLQEVALLQVLVLEAVVVGYQNFAWTTVETPFIGQFATNFLVVVAIDSTNFATGDFADQAIGYFASFSIGYFAGFAKEVGFAMGVESTEKDSDNFGFSIGYYKDLKIAEDLEAYLFLEPMVDIEQ